jgi:FHS family L-fucose permease-like MFS transporter
MGIPAGKMLEKIGYKKSALTALIAGFVGVLILFLAGKVGSFPFIYSVHLFQDFLCVF